MYVYICMHIYTLYIYVHVCANVHIFKTTYIHVYTYLSQNDGVLWQNQCWFHGFLHIRCICITICNQINKYI